MDVRESLAKLSWEVEPTSGVCTVYTQDQEKNEL